jgi:hypothetical protein
MRGAGKRGHQALPPAISMAFSLLPTKAGPQGTELYITSANDVQVSGDWGPGSLPPAGGNVGFLSGSTARGMAGAAF